MIGADVVGFDALIQDPDPAAVAATKARLLAGLLACLEQRPRHALRRFRHPGCAPTSVYDAVYQTRHPGGKGAPL